MSIILYFISRNVKNYTLAGSLGFYRLSFIVYRLLDFLRENSYNTNNQITKNKIKINKQTRNSIYFFHLVIRANEKIKVCKIDAIGWKINSIK